MKGLLEKDRLYFITQGPLFVVGVMLLIYAFILADPLLISRECCIIAAVFTFALVGVDNRDGFAFLMTMPVDAKTYVLEKNLFSWLSLALFWLVSRILMMASAMTFSRETYTFAELISSDYLCFLIAGVLVSLFIFLMLKFKTANLLIVVSVIVMSTMLFLLVSITSGFTGIVRLIIVYDKLKNLPPVLTAVVSVPATVVLCAVFIKLGIMVMKKKEF